MKADDDETGTRKLYRWQKERQERKFWRNLGTVKMCRVGKVSGKDNLYDGRDGTYGWDTIVRLQILNKGFSANAVINS